MTRAGKATHTSTAGTRAGSDGERRLAWQRHGGTNSQREQLAPRQRRRSQL